MSRKRMSDNPSTSSGNENADRDTTQPTPEQRSLDKSLPRTFPVQPEAPAASDSTDDKPSQSSGEADRTRQREDRVREAAHRRFIERGREHGHDVEDWLDAERDVDREDPAASPR